MKKVLILIVAYNAEKHIASVLDRIPHRIWDNEEYHSEIIIIDDSSSDATFDVSRSYASRFKRDIHVFRTPTNQGYGGNQKLGYMYAMEHGFDAVVMLHGDGQYAPELLHEMIAPVLAGQAEVVFGSRMMQRKNALKGGMPLYKFIGNIILTKIQNRMIGTRLTEFHTGYRAYSVPALKRIPFQCNSDWFDFDTDIIIQLADNKIPIHEIAIPTHYGDEVCHVNGLKYAVAILIACLESRGQRLGIFYNRKFDYQNSSIPLYENKSHFESSHRFAIDAVGEGLRVLDIGGGAGYVASALKEKNCYVVGMDECLSALPQAFDQFIQADLVHITQEQLPNEAFDVILLLDVIERVASPEELMEMLRHYTSPSNTRILIATPNIAFILVRLMLLLGRFQYGKRGILDRTHKRLFTFHSLRRLMDQAGFEIVKVVGIPAPFPLALPHSKLGMRLLRLNSFMIRISKGMFSYQIAFEVLPKKDLGSVYAQTLSSSDKSRI